MKNKLDEIKAIPNHEDRTFTIWKYYGRKLIAKYRTIPLDEDEFEYCLNNSTSDWRWFLKSTEHYNIKLH